MIEIAGNNFILPQTVEVLDKNNEPQYFDIIGKEGVEARKKAKIELDSSLTIIDPLTTVDIQIESGLGFTEQGKRDTMMQIANYIGPLVQQQVLPPESLKVAVQELLETFSFGSTQEFMQAMENGNMPQDFTQEQLQKLKIAMLETMKDAGIAGKENDQRMVDSTKVGVLEALKESGLADKMNQVGVQDNPELAPIPYKDAPPSIKRQMEANAGLTPATDEAPSDVAAKTKVADSIVKAKVADDQKELQEKTVDKEGKKEDATE